jgi:hypothetical protein
MRRRQRQDAPPHVSMELDQNREHPVVRCARSGRQSIGDFALQHQRGVHRAAANPMGFKHRNRIGDDTL